MRMLSQQGKRNMLSSKWLFVISRPRALPVRSPEQSDNEGEEGEGGEEEGVPNVPMEQDSGGSGAVGDAALCGYR